MPANATMPTLNVPLRFEPYLRPSVWGGRALGNRLGRILPGPDSYGESWEVSDHPTHLSKVASGPWKGNTLRELMQWHREDLLGAAAGREAVFPWLVKYLDAEGLLSVQVHPDDRQVQRFLPGERGKTEAWVVLDAAPNGRIWHGLRPGVDERELRRGLAEGNVVDRLIEYRPAAGQCFFLPAGTVHAVGGGVLLAEIQQTSDATFRLFDWGRTSPQGTPRPLHVEESLACIAWDRPAPEPVTLQGFPGESGEGAKEGAVRPRMQDLVRCDYFHLSWLQGSVPFALGGRGRSTVFLALEGRGRFENGEAILPHQVWVLPATLPETLVVPESPLGLLVALLP